MTQMKHLSIVDGAFLHMESAEMPMHVGSLNLFEPPGGLFRRGLLRGGQGARRQAHAHGGGVHPQARADAVRPRQPGLDPRRRHRPRLPRALHGAAQAGHDRAARGARRAAALDAARPQPAALGVLHHRRAWPTAASASTARCTTPPSTARPAWRWRPACSTSRPSRARSSRRARCAPTPTSSASPSCSPRRCTNQIRQVVAERQAGARSSPRRPARRRRRSPSGAAKADDDRAARKAEKPPTRFKLAPATPFNHSITNQRAFAAVSLPLPEIKSIGKGLGASINDMVLWLCSTALRAYLKDSRELPEKSLVAGVPISLRQEGDTTAEQPGRRHADRPRHRDRRPGRAAEGDQARHGGDEEADGHLRRRHPDRLPLARLALADQRPGLALRALAHRRLAAHRQRDDLQRARLAGAGVPGAARR